MTHPWETSTCEEEAFFAEIRAREPSFYTVIRQSRSGGHDHVIHLDKISHTPIDLEHLCSCAAGSEGRACWAVLEVLQEQMPGTAVANVAKLIAEARSAKSFKQGRRSHDEQ